MPMSEGPGRDPSHYAPARGPAPEGAEARRSSTGGLRKDPRTEGTAPLGGDEVLKGNISSPILCQMCQKILYIEYIEYAHLEGDRIPARAHPLGHVVYVYSLIKRYIII